MKYTVVNIVIRISLISCCFFIFFSLVGCNNVKIIKSIEFIPPVIPKETLIINYDSDLFMPVLTDSLKKELKKNKLPMFIMDECLDLNYHFEVSSHYFISTRYRLLQNLNEREVKKLYRLAKKYDLSKKCESMSEYTGFENCKSPEVQSGFKSTFMIIQERLNELKNNSKLK